MHYSLTRATLWNLAGYLYLIIASLIATPVLVHQLGLSLFAQYSLIIATLVLVSSFNLGLPQAVTRALAKKKTLTLWVTSSLLFILTGVVGGILATIIAYYLGVRYAILPVTFAIALMSNLVAHYQTLPHAEGHFGYFNAKTFIVGTANTLLAAYLAWIGQGIAVILSSQLLCYLITLLPLVFFSLKHFPRPWQGKPSLSIAKSLLTFGLKNQVGTFVGQIQSQYAKYLLAALSPLTLSAYIIAQGLVQKLAGGVTSLATALYPASSRSNIRPLYHRLQIALAFSGLLVFWCYKTFGFVFLTWWLNSPDLVTLVHSILTLLIWYFGILILTPLASTILDSRGRPELTSLFATLTTIIEIVIAILLFPRYGLVAPVYGALIAVSLTTPVLLFTTERVLKSTI